MNSLKGWAPVIEDLGGEGRRGYFLRVSLGCKVLFFLSVYSLRSKAEKESCQVHYFMLLIGCSV